MVVIPGLLGVHFESGFAHQGAQELNVVSAGTISNVNLCAEPFAQGAGRKVIGRHVGNQLSSLLSERFTSSRIVC